MISQGCLLSSLLLSIILDVLAKEVGQEKEINQFRFEKKVNISVFTDKVILYVENPKGFMEELLELINRYNKVAVHRSIS